MRRNREIEPPYEEAEPTREYAPYAEASPYRVETDEPYDADAAYDDAPYEQEPYDDAPYEQAPYDEAPYEEPLYDEEYSDEHEELDNEHRLRVAMNAFDAFSVVLGCVCIFVLVTLLISLFNWLVTDITHGLSIFGSQLQ